MCLDILYTKTRVERAYYCSQYNIIFFLSIKYKPLYERRLSDSALYLFIDVSQTNNNRKQFQLMYVYNII